MEATAPNGFIQSRRGRWLLISAIVLVLIGVLWWAYWYFHARFYQDTDDAYVANDLVNVVSQVSGTVVSIGADGAGRGRAGRGRGRRGRGGAGGAGRGAE